MDASSAGVSEGGPLGGPDGGPLGGPEGGPDGGPLGGPDGGPLGGPEGGPDGGPLGGPEGGPLGGPDGEPVGVGLSSGGDGAASGACSRVPMSPKASPSMLSSWDCSSSSRVFSADVFPFTTVAPISPTWRGLNSGCVPDKVLQPAWCRGYHAGLSFLRPGFNSRSGRLRFLIASEALRGLANGKSWHQVPHERQHQE